MKRLKPLKQFVCDTCGEIINAPEEGWFEWLYDSSPRKAHSFRICHHKVYSPLAKQDGCYQHGGKSGHGDMHLHHLLENPMAHLLQFLDRGKYHEPEFSGPHVADLREWVECVRRLTIPFYEEARLHRTKAIRDGHYAGANEIFVFTEGFLKDLVNEYGEER